jgi:UDP-hydrolysing UDP-N-acetyl-D-glucosamine 2-epimerase
MGRVMFRCSNSNYIPNAIMKNNITFFLSNRCSYARSKVLLDELNDKFHLTVLITGNILNEGMDGIYEELHKKYNTIDLITVADTNSKQGMASCSIELSALVLDRFNRKKPDAVVLWADRFELLPVALIAKYMDIPIVHIQGGETSGNIDNYVRNAISMLSQVHCVSHTDAASTLKRYGLKNIYDTGCPSIDVINNIKFEKPTHDYIVCLFHPHTEEIEKANQQTKALMNNVIKFCEVNNFSIYWFAPNNDPGHLDVLNATTNISIIKNLVGDKYLNLLHGAKMIVGNSSSGIRESSYMGIPSVIVGDRQRDRLTASNVLRCDFNNIYETLEKALTLKPKTSKLFGDGKSSPRIATVIKDYLWEKNLKN